MNASPKSGLETAPKRVHIVGICGVATSALAIAFQKKGWDVTGSDKGFYPPVSTHLDEAGILYYAGWHPEKIEELGRPDIMIAGGIGTGTSNPELAYAREKGITLLSFAEAIGRYIIKKNSIVTSGTWGKTTCSSLLSFILLEAGMDPSYFTGGVSLSHDAGALSDSDWSVVEGDEYQTSISDKKPKFAYYSPTCLLLTSVSWDHADLYPTEESYFKAFEKLVRDMPSSGLIVACIDDNGVRKTLDAAGIRAGNAGAGKKTVSYGLAETADYSCREIKHSRKGLDFIIRHGGVDYEISSPMLGRYNAENIAGCFAMAHAVGIALEKIVAAIAAFKGIRRRFEKRFEGETTVFDCHAPTPEKASAALASLREIYDERIIAVYEPNIGGRQRASSGAYDNAFKDADLVLIPRLTKLKAADAAAKGDAADSLEKPLEGEELAALMAKTHANIRYIEDDGQLIDTALSNAKKGDVIVFLGSHGFRGMIEEAVKKAA